MKRRTPPSVLARLDRIEAVLRRRTRVPLEDITDPAALEAAIDTAEPDELAAFVETLDDDEIEALIAEEATP